ncbi:FUSC family protein [Helicobacter suis]|uniref:FUSC family protein n=1 Tax=Helicobacter suis TaxID=104628 RepID=UPI001F07DBF2|nr:FUSC family protein [Helicobacter suis]
MEIFNRLKRAVHLYDPGYFSLVYALRTTLMTFVCAGLGTFFFGYSIAIWAGFQAVFLYFSSLLISDKEHEIYYLLVFIGVSCFNALIFYPMAHFGAWLCVPIAITTFLVGMAMAYSLDLYKVCNAALSNGLVTCLYVDANAPLDLTQTLLMISVLGCLSLVIQHFIVTKYGYFVKKRFSTLLSSMELMLQYINSPTEYTHIKTQVLSQIHNTKVILTSRSSRIKNPHTIQNLQRALFQLHALEEIYHSIHSIGGYLGTLESVCQEIILNLQTLSGIFTKQHIEIQKAALNNLSPQLDKVVRHSIAIIYNKMEIFLLGGEEQVAPSNPEYKSTFKNVLKAFNIKNAIFQYASKYAIAMGIAVFIARYFGFNHGMWIAMATLLISRSSLGSIREAQLEFVMGSCIGLVLGLLVVELFDGSVIFYGFLVVGVFFFIYLKVYSYATWSAALMFAFILCFSLLTHDFMGMVVSRVVDLLIGIGIVYVIFLFIWPKYDKDEFIQHTRHLVTTLRCLLEAYSDATQVLHLQNTFLRQLDAFRLCLKNARTETSEPNTLKSLFRGLKAVDILDTCSYRLYDYCLNIKLSKDKQLLLDNNTQILLGRYLQMLNYLNNKPHYFKAKEGNRLLKIDSELDALLRTMFFAQNKLFREIMYVFKY